MKRRLVSVDAAINAGIYEVLNQKFAEDVISGRIVHNVETEKFVLREHADEDFLAEAAAAYKRLMQERSA